MIMDAIGKIEEWANRNSSPRADFVRELSKMLRDERKRPTLSLIDLHREILARPHSNKPQWLTKFLHPARAVLGGLYLAPVAYTWWELRKVLGEFADDSSLRDGVSLIAFWTGQEGDYSGLSLQLVGLIIALFVILLLVVQIGLDLTVEDDENLPTELSEALFEIQFDLAQTRVLTPQEFTETISAAAGELEFALTTITSTVTEAAAMIEQVSRTTDGLTAASTTIGEVSTKLIAAIEPIINLESSLRSADQAIQKSTQSMKEMQNLISSTAARIDSSEKDTARIAQSTVNIVNATSALITQVESANNVLVQTAHQFATAVQSSSTVAQRLGEILDLIDDRGAQLLTVREIAQDMSNASFEIGRSVAEMKQASELFVSVNREIVSVLKENGLGNS